MLIAALDPGKVTGMAFIRVHDDVPLMDTLYNIELPAMEAVAELDAWLENSVYGLVVCEAFTISPMTARHSAQNDALEVIGAARYLSGKYKYAFQTQPPSVRKVIGTSNLQKLGWYNPSPDKHMIDAARHLAVVLMREQILSPGEVLT